MKKPFLMVLMLGFVNSDMSAESDIDAAGAVLAASITTGLVATSATYFACRESNSKKVEKIEGIWRHITDNASNIRSEDFSKLVPVFKDFDIFVSELYHDIKTRYDSWKTPWNWMPSMRLAYKKATLLHILFKYLMILKGWHNDISDRSIEKFARSVCHNNYSLKSFVNLLNNDIQTITFMMKDLYCPFGNRLYEHLITIRNMTERSNGYKQEESRPVNAV